MHPLALLLGFSTIIGFNSDALAAGSATVVVLRGKATSDGNPIQEKQKINPGSTVKTEAGSFVKLLFADNTQLNVGPNTTMKLEDTKEGSASLVDLVGGTIRAKVTKDLLKKNDGGPIKEKMVIKTKTAAMGIRGTDFNVSFNQANNTTALITFEGSVAMAALMAGANPMAALQATSGVQAVGAGQFSGASPDQPQASIPVKISPAQLESMKANVNFEQGKAEKSTAMSSPVPPGIDPRSFSSGSDKTLAEGVAKAVGESNLSSAIQESVKGESTSTQKAPPEGFINKATGEYAPRAGGFIDLASGRYVPPPPGSAFDPNTGVFTPPRAMGAFDPSTGSYVPPKGVTLDPVKGFVAEAPRVPAGATAAGSAPPPPPPPAVQALVVAMNTAVKPENAGVTVTNDPTFAPIAPKADGTFAPPPPPPPPSGLPPPPPPGADEQTNEPTTDPCAAKACEVPDTTPTPTETSVDFSISVTN